MNGAAPPLDETLDLTGVPCPNNVARALVRLEGLASGAVLAILVDDGEPATNVADGVVADGHELLAREPVGRQWRLLVRRANLP
jgi:TusA-related sulfurtransferase